MKLATVLATNGNTVAAIAPDAPLAEAIRILAARNIGALVVLDPLERVVGIISERDIIRAFAGDRAAFDRPVSAFMTADVVCGSPDDDVVLVLDAMTAGHFRHLPVIDDGRLAGIVTTGDLVQALLQDFVGRVETLELRLEARIQEFGVGR
jgi:CBS domain-containing protein